MNAIVCLFAKPPLPGQVKTRLVPVLGEEGAARLARAFLLDTWRALLQDDGSTWTAVLATTGPMPPELAIDPARAWEQGDGDLGVRMERALRRALSSSQRALVIGADAPLAGPARWREALARLEDHDAVLGRADDGGFDLIGLRRCPVDLLRDLPWSTPRTLEATTNRLRAHGLSVALLSPLFDVDEPRDLQRLITEARAGAPVGDATRACLNELKGVSVV